MEQGCGPAPSSTASALVDYEMPGCRDRRRRDSSRSWRPNCGRSLARLVMAPAWMLTCNADSANFASSLVSEAPSTKNFERLQRYLARRYGREPGTGIGEPGLAAGPRRRATRCFTVGCLSPGQDPGRGAQPGRPRSRPGSHSQRCLHGRRTAEPADRGPGAGPGLEPRNRPTGPSWACRRLVRPSNRRCRTASRASQARRSRANLSSRWTQTRGRNDRRDPGGRGSASEVFAVTPYSTLALGRWCMVSAPTPEPA